MNVALSEGEVHFKAFNFKKGAFLSFDRCPIDDVVHSNVDVSEIGISVSYDWEHKDPSFANVFAYQSQMFAGTVHNHAALLQINPDKSDFY